MIRILHAIKVIFFHPFNTKTWHTTATILWVLNTTHPPPWWVFGALTCGGLLMVVAPYPSCHPLLTALLSAPSMLCGWHLLRISCCVQSGTTYPRRSIILQRWATRGNIRYSLTKCYKRMQYPRLSLAGIVILSIQVNFTLKWIPADLIDDKSTLVKVMAWCRQAPSHYLSQCWLRSMSA